MNILVTGGAGYVGTTLIPQLLERGDRVRVLDNLMYGGDQLLPFFRHPNFEFVYGDVRSPKDMVQAIKGQDAIIHLAAIVGFPACQKYERLATEVNLEATQLLASLVSKDQLVLFASTGSNYGAVKDEICTEETPLNPLSHYGRTKTAAEAYLLQNCTTIAYRFATAFGVSPRMRLDLMVNDFVHKALDHRYLIVYERHFMRTFIHVYDMGRAFVFALDHADEMKGEVYNVGSSSMNYSKQDICEMIQARVPGFYLHYADVGEDADKRNYIVSYDKIASLGYETTITVEAGIDELIRAMQVIRFNEKYSNV